jgi:hypothetical protein
MKMSCCDPFPTDIAQICSNQNCAEGGRVVWSGRFDILAAANGASFNTPAIAAGAGVPAVRGDHLVLRPYDGEIQALGLQIDGIDGVSGSPFSTLVGYGEIKHKGKDIRPTLLGSYENYTTAGEATDPDRYLKNGINPLNPSCLPRFSHDSPLLIGLDSGGFDRSGVVLTFEGMYVG